MRITFLHPSIYKDWVVAEPLVLQNGRELTVGDRLVDLFPRGIGVEMLPEGGMRCWDGADVGEVIQ